MASAEPPTAQIDESELSNQGRGEPVQQDLAAVTARHHPRRTIEHCAVVVGAPQLGLTRCDAHPNRQREIPLCRYRRLDCIPRRLKDGAHAVAGVLEHLAVMVVDLGAQYPIVVFECDAHLVSVGLPPSGRSFDVGEQERDDSRRGLLIGPRIHAGSTRPPRHVHSSTLNPIPRKVYIVCRGDPGGPRFRRSGAQ